MIRYDPRSWPPRVADMRESLVVSVAALTVPERAFCVPRPYTVQHGR
jgi:hypothetical protein